MVKIKFPALEARKFRGVFICKRCGTKMKADMRKITEGKIKCRRCNRKVFRPKSKTTKKEKR